MPDSVNDDSSGNPFVELLDFADGVVQDSKVHRS